ncbi:MAG: N-formylglutamate amidohydrolase [Geminicoccaceae bacterium]|nr:N-formylglutamate amidohydrolase [Geminicoccaceae bacterium]
MDVRGTPAYRAGDAEEGGAEAGDRAVGPDGDLPAGHRCWCAGHRRSPLVLSSAHSGTLLPARFLATVRVEAAQLHALSDGPVDRLLGFAREDGITLVTGVYGRAVIDLNRRASELFPALLQSPEKRGLDVSPKVRAGLGLIPTRVGGVDIYARRLSDAEVAWRRDHIHAPFHAALEECAAANVATHGQSLLLDCHSMPSAVAGPPHRRIDAVLGDLHGRSAAPGLTARAAAVLRDLGLRVALNDPYAGGHITERHGRPAIGRSALQIELRRDLFMDERTHRLTAGADALSRALRSLVLQLEKVLLEGCAGRGVQAPFETGEPLPVVDAA